jgi:hypothetical protein
MIDSTGEHGVVTIECADRGCCLRFQLPTYKPTFGHMGEDVNEGTYFDALSYERFGDLMQVFEAGRLFKVVKASDPAEVEIYHMVPSRGIYSYDGAIMPEFGSEPGQVIWVCKRCMSLMSYLGEHPWAKVLAATETRPGMRAPCLTNTVLRYMPDRRAV